MILLLKSVIRALQVYRAVLPLPGGH